MNKFNSEASWLQGRHGTGFWRVCISVFDHRLVVYSKYLLGLSFSGCCWLFYLATLGSHLRTTPNPSRRCVSRIWRVRVRLRSMGQATSSYKAWEAVSPRNKCTTGCERRVWRVRSLQQLRSLLSCWCVKLSFSSHLGYCYLYPTRHISVYYRSWIHLLPIPPCAVLSCLLDICAPRSRRNGKVRVAVLIVLIFYFED